MHRSFCMIFSVILFFSFGLVWSQKNSKINWLGYVKNVCQMNIVEDEDYLEFKQFLTCIGLRADINKYSSAFVFFYFNYPDLNTNGEYRNIAGLLDAHAEFTPIEDLTFVTGQFVVPFATENILSPSKMDFINRPYLTSLNSPSYRDIGAYLTYKKSFAAGYAGVVNGSGMNTLDKNKYKNFIFRCEIKPMKNLAFAGGGSLGKDNLPTDSVHTQNFYSAGISYKLGDFYIITEGSYQDYMGKSTKAMYAYAQYDFPVNANLFHYLTPGIRYDFLDKPDKNDRIDRFTFGLSFNFHEKKFMSLIRLNYELVKSQQPGVEPPDVFMIEMQMRFD